MMGKSMSPPTYQPLWGDVGNNEYQFPNGVRKTSLPSSSQGSSQQISNKTKNSVEINDTVVRASKDVIQSQSKSKFIVTRAVDPLHFDES